MKNRSGCRFFGLCGREVAPKFRFLQLVAWLLAADGCWAALRAAIAGCWLLAGWMDEGVSVIPFVQNLRFWAPMRSFFSARAGARCSAHAEFAPSLGFASAAPRPFGPRGSAFSAADLPRRRA